MRSFRFLFGAALLPFAALAQTNQADPGFIRIFDGRSLFGWEGDPALWSVQHGAIVGRRVTAKKPGEGNTFLIWTGGLVRNFELRASFRMLPENAQNWANSGIQYRSRVVDPQHWVVRGYQADMDESGRYVGQIYEEGYRGFLALPGQRVRITDGGDKPKIEILGETAPAAAVKSAYHPLAWNVYDIVADGTHIRQYVNGVLTAEAFDLDGPHAAQSGVVALQLHAGLPMAVEFRNIYLKTLP